MEKVRAIIERILTILLAAGLILCLIWCIPQFAGNQPVIEGSTIYYVAAGEPPVNGEKNAYYHARGGLVIGTLTLQEDGTYLAEDGSSVTSQQVLGPVRSTIPYAGAFFGLFTGRRTVMILLILAVLVIVLHQSKDTDKETPEEKTVFKKEDRAKNLPADPKKEEKTPVLPEDQEPDTGDLSVLDLDAKWGEDVPDNPHWADDVPEETEEKEDELPLPGDGDDESDYPEDPNPDDDFDI